MPSHIPGRIGHVIAADAHTVDTLAAISALKSQKAIAKYVEKAHVAGRDVRLSIAPEVHALFARCTLSLRDGARPLETALETLLYP